MTLDEKLQAIQSELNVPKNQENKFGGYKYRSCEDILNAVKPLMAKHKVTLVLSDEVTQIGDRYYVRTEAILKDAEDKEAQICVSGFAREEEVKKGMDSSQITGAASSYARKYALNGLFAIDDAKDSDATNVIKCEHCKNVIQGHEKFSGAQIAAMSKKKYGKTLCYECSVKQRDANNAKKEKKDA